MDVRPNSPSSHLAALVESHGVRNLLHSNDVPTDDGRRQREASRETGRAHLTFLNETIHSFTLQLAVEDLPEVTLEYIRSADVVDSLSMRHPSWTLSHVCRQWRHAIQRCPPCWTNIVLSFDRPAQSIKLAFY